MRSKEPWLEILNTKISRSRALIIDFLIFYKSYSLERSRRKPLNQSFSLTKISLGTAGKLELSGIGFKYPVVQSDPGHPIWVKGDSRIYWGNGRSRT